MLDVISIYEIYDAVDGEISQKGNINAYSKILLLPKQKQVAKVCYKNWDLWHKNLTNLKLICNQISPQDFPEIVFPTGLLEHKGDIVGYLMPYIEGNTLFEVMDCKLFSTRDILMIFNRIASVIQRLPKNIHLGDLHPGNIIVSNDGNISLIDIDGFSVDEGYSMTCPLCIEDLPLLKYLNNDNSVKIGENTDIYCLLHIFLNWLFDEINPFMFSNRRFSLFLEYLTIKGIPLHITDTFKRIKESEENYLIPSLFTYFVGVLDNISYDDFLCVMGIQEEENRYEQYINQIIKENLNGKKVL